MKYIFILIFAVGITSCKKCYECEIKKTHEQMEVCKGDAWYDAIKRGETFTDEQGNPFVCH